MKDFLKKVFNIGIAGFGGPAILGFIKNEFVEKDKIVTESDFFEGLSLAQMLPGATGVNLLSYIAYKKYNIFAAFLAFILFVAPSVLSMLFFSYIYFTYGNIEIVKNIFDNINIAVVVIFILTIEKIVIPIAKKRLNIFIMISVLSAKLFFNINVFILLGMSILLILLLDKTAASQQKRVKKPLFLFKPIAFFLVFIISVILAYIFRQNSFLNLFYNFSKIGFMVFGGGTASIPMIHDALVLDLKWLTNHEFLTGISIAQLTPGPVLNISTFCGYKLYGFLGSIVATIGIFLPGFLLTLILSGYSDYILSKPLFKKISTGILVGFTGMLLYVFINFFSQTVTNIKTAGFFGILLFMQSKFKLPPVIIILITIPLGLLLNFIVP